MQLNERSMECPHPDEEIFAQEIINIMSNSLQSTYGEGKFLKGFHAKNIALLEASLRVEEDIEEVLKVGLFKNPKTYKAWVRFSNASDRILPDEKRGMRGMAIKILNLEESPIEKDDLGNTQDILLTNNPITIPGTVELQADAIKAKFTSNRYYIKLFKSNSWEKIKQLRQWLKGQVKTGNLLSLNYYSAVPYLFGPGKAVKWHARPVNPINIPINKPLHKSYLRHRLTDILRNETASFELCVQFQESPEKEPIEDASVVWHSEFKKVATLTILKQEFDTPQRKTLSETMHFSPWHCIPEHRPLGGINRLRRRIYSELFSKRKKHNDTIEQNLVRI